MGAPDFAAIDHYIKAQMQATRLSGLALGIVQGDQIVHLKGFGSADPTGRAVTPTSLHCRRGQPLAMDGLMLLSAERW